MLQPLQEDEGPRSSGEEPQALGSIPTSPSKQAETPDNEKQVLLTAIPGSPCQGEVRKDKVEGPDPQTLIESWELLGLERWLST